MRRPNGPVIRPPEPPVFIQACAAILVMWVLYYVLSFIVGELTVLIGSVL
jgi:hypothetical protein